MIEYRSNGSIFDVSADALVNAVNCVGTMGAGVALAFKKRFPVMCHEYVKDALAGNIAVGHVTTWTNPSKNKPRFIINLPTKKYWQDPSEYGWISSGLDALVSELANLNIASVAIPALGCGNGKLEFHKVKPMIDEKLGKLDHLWVIVFEPR